MKRITLILSLLLCISFAFGSSWVNINSENPAPAEITLNYSDITTSQISFSFEGFYKNEVQTPNGQAFTIDLDEATPILLKGAPDLPKLTGSVIIPDLAKMDVKVVSSSFVEYTGIEVAPSKGNFTRDIDPESVPYTYGRQYNEDAFFPGKLAELRDTYIIRDYRGQTVIVYPFQYNPVTKVLRVYSEITVEVTQVDNNGINPLHRNQELTSIDVEFGKLYDVHFLNTTASRYDPVDDHGNMLIISYGAFMTAMQPFVDWKIKIGTPVEMVDVATIGNSQAIKTYIADYYNNNGLTFVLLVGDAAQVPSSYATGDSDNNYSYIVGNDHYPDLFMGRFSAENVDQVEIQVEKTLEYEQDPYKDVDWFSVNIGIASAEGPGDDNEYDYEHVRNIQTDLINFTYTASKELFDGSQGGLDAPGNPTPQMVTDEVNAGASVINYTGHGSDVSWGTSGFSNSDINQLTNDNMLPFIWSVACVNGNFVNGTCFAEAWLRATNNGEPSGAVATMMSTINQSWNPPMDGQDEMNDILVESYADNIKRTFGGISMNGCMHMNDEYGSQGDSETDTWTCFGDPSLMVRTAMPQDMTATYNSTVFIGATQLTVTSDAEGGLVALTLDGEIIATAFVEGGSALLEFDALTDVGMITIAITAFNYIPDLGEIEIIPANGPYVVYNSHEVNDSQGNNNGLLDYGEGSYLTITMENVGTEDANNVEVVLTTEDDYVTIIDGTETYGNIPAGTTLSVADAFEVSIANDIPDNHIILFTISSSGTSDDTWPSSFTETGHAPVVHFDGFTIDDASGNNNGKIDPGETVDITITVANNGSSDAINVIGELSSVSEYITIPSPTAPFGDLAAGATLESTYSVTADAGTPAGHSANFEIDFTANLGITGNGAFVAVVGQMPVLIVDFDGNSNSSSEMQECFGNLGVAAEYSTSLDGEDLALYTSVFVCLGIYQDNHVLSDAEGQQLANFLDNGGKLYMEGGDTWAYDNATAVHPMFNITGVEDGSGDLSSIAGQDGTFAEGMSYTYGGENSYIDHIAAIEPAQNLFQNQSPEYYCAVSYDAGTYKTIGASFEFGGLNDGSNTKDELMYEIMNFFGIPTIWVGNNEIQTGENISLNTYPNPFGNDVKILFSVPEDQNVSIEIYNITGQKVASLLNGVKSSGLHNLEWNTSGLNKGIYFCRLIVGDKVTTKKMIKH